MKIKQKTSLFLALSFYIGSALLAGSSPVFSSPEPDSLQLALTDARDTTRINILNQLAARHQFSDPDQAKQYLDLSLTEAQQIDFVKGKAEAMLSMGVYFLLRKNNKACENYTVNALGLFEKLNHQKGRAECYKNLGVVHFYEGKYPEAIREYRQAISLFEEINDLSGQAKCYANLGLIYDHYGNYQEALRYFLNSLKINETINNKEGIASNYGYIALVYNNLEEFQNALTYQHKALQIFEDAGNKTRIGGLLSDMGNNYLNLKEYTKALNYQRHALAINEALEDTRKMAHAYNNIGNVYKEMQQFSLALTYYEKSLRLKEEVGEKRTLAGTLKNIAQIHIYLSDYDRAIEYAKLALARELDSKKDKQKIYLTLSEAYTKQEDYQKALACYQQYSALKDSILDEEKTRQIAEMQTQYDVEKKEQEITAQQQEITLLEKNKITERNLRIALTGGSILLILLALFIYSRYRTKQKTAKVLDQKNKEIENKNKEIKVINKELEKRMLRAQMDPHFIFNALNAIQHLITINDKTAALKYLSKFSKLVRQTLENSVNYKVSVADEVRLLQYYLELESLRFDNEFAFAIEVDEGLDIYNVEIPFLLLQPYVENAIVHGLRHKKGSGTLKVQLQGEKDYLHCIVEDNGIGREEATKIMVNSGKRHTSRGMSVTDQRLATLNTDQERKTQLKITDLYDNHQKAAGTKVEIFIPLELN